MIETSKPNILTDLLYLDYSWAVSMIYQREKTAYTINKPDDVQVIALMAKAGAGKSTLARILERDYGFKRITFANKVKEYTHLFTALPQKSGIRYRTLYIEFGENCKKIDPFIWVKILAGELNELIAQGNKKIVIDDLRFPQERLWALENKILTVAVRASKEVRKQRVQDRGEDIQPVDFENITEKWLDILHADYEVRNNTSNLKDLENEAKALSDFAKEIYGGRMKLW